jgi:hypothetical protein
MDFLMLSQLEMEEILLREGSIDRFSREVERFERNGQASSNEETTLQNLESSMAAPPTLTRIRYAAEDAELLLFRDVEEWNTVVSLLVSGNQVRAVSCHLQWS